MSDVDFDTHNGTSLDPRIKEELEHLNTTSAEINGLEKQLDESRQQFRQTLTESTQRLNEKSRRCRKSVAKAHNYHEAKEEARQAHESAQEAALRYKRSVSMYRAAKETIAIAEEAAIPVGGHVEKKRQFDSALQEMLNLSTIKLNAADREKTESKREHDERSQRYISAQQKVDKLAKKFKRSIARSGSYYELKKSFFYDLNDLKIRIEALQKTIQESKGKYRQALKNLEKISDDIHQSRQVAMMLVKNRECGVGADSNTESESEHEKLDIRFQLDDSFSDDISSTDQESIPSETASFSSPTTQRLLKDLKGSPRSISGTSLPSQADSESSFTIAIEGASSISTEADNVGVLSTSPESKYNDDDDDIFMGVESDDDLCTDDSDEDDINIKSARKTDGLASKDESKSTIQTETESDSSQAVMGISSELRNSGISRRLRTISIGELKSFNANDDDDDVNNLQKTEMTPTVTDKDATTQHKLTPDDGPSRTLTSCTPRGTLLKDIAKSNHLSNKSKGVPCEKANNEVIWI